MIFRVKVHKGKWMVEEEYYTASEALKDFAIECKKNKGKKVTVVMEDQNGEKILIKNLKK